MPRGRPPFSQDRRREMEEPPPPFDRMGSRTLPQDSRSSYDPRRGGDPLPPSRYQPPPPNSMPGSMPRGPSPPFRRDSMPSQGFIGPPPDYPRGQDERSRRSLSPGPRGRSPEGYSGRRGSGDGRSSGPPAYMPEAWGYRGTAPLISSSPHSFESLCKNCHPSRFCPRPALAFMPCRP